MLVPTKCLSLGLNFLFVSFVSASGMFCFILFFNLLFAMLCSAIRSAQISYLTIVLFTYVLLHFIKTFKCII